MRMIKTLLALGAISAATAASAVTVFSTPGAPDPGPAAGSTLLVDFNGALPAGFTLTGNYTLPTGTTSSGAEPAGDTTRYLDVSSVPGGNTATLTTATDLSLISFYWGSIDTYNTVDVLGAGGVSIYTLSGAMIPPANGDQSASATNKRVTFVAGAGEVITGLTFTSTGVAFEVDDVAGRLVGDGSGSNIPEPATWAMMLGGFALVGAATRRRRSTTVTA